jgi:hypothetical protein
MERAFFGDDHVIVFKTICCFLVLTLNFTFFRDIALRLPFCMLLGQPSGKFVTAGQRVLATRCQRVLANLWQISQKVLVTFANCTYLSEGCQYPLFLRQRALITLQSSWQRVPRYKPWGWIPRPQCPPSYPLDSCRLTPLCLPTDILLLQAKDDISIMESLLDPEQLRFFFLSMETLEKLPCKPGISVLTILDGQSTTNKWEKSIGIIHFHSALSIYCTRSDTLTNCFIEIPDKAFRNYQCFL